MQGLKGSVSRMRTLKTSEAAALLNVSPNTLRAWERRFGYPKPQRSPGSTGCTPTARSPRCAMRCRRGCRSRRRFPGRVRRSGPTRTCSSARSSPSSSSGPTARWRRRSRCAPSSARWRRCCSRRSPRSATATASTARPWAFAARWADGWLRRAQRLAPPPVRPLTLLVGDATRDELDPDALAVRAPSSCSPRAPACGFCALPVSGVAGLGDVLSAFRPRRRRHRRRPRQDDDVARWAYRVRAAAGPLPVALFRRPRGARVRTTGARVLCRHALRGPSPGPLARRRAQPRGDAHRVHRQLTTPRQPAGQVGA